MLQGNGTGHCVPKYFCIVRVAGCRLIGILFLGHGLDLSSETGDYGLTGTLSIVRALFSANNVEQDLSAARRYAAARCNSENISQ